MGFFDLLTIHVFSNVSGIVTFQGEPVDGAKIIRTADHEHDKVYTDTTTTDKDGQFSFKGISTFTLRPIMMMGTIIRQKIMIKYQGMEYLAWRTLKRNNYKYGELNDEDAESPVNFHLLCELTNPQDERKVVQFKIFRQSVRGLCKWEGSENLVIKNQKEEL